MTDRPIPLSVVRRKIDEINSRVILMAPIDAGIQDLVAGLMRWGIETSMSCEGHRRGHFPLPFVDIAKRHADKALVLAGDWALDPASRYVWGLTLPRFFDQSGRDIGGPQRIYRLQPMRRKDMRAADLATAKPDARAFGQFLLRRRR